MKTRIFRIILILTIVLSLFFIFTSSQIFNVSSIVVNGNNRVAESEILKLAQVYEGMNVFTLNIGKAKKGILSNSYVQDVKINVNYLKKEILFIIEERNLSGYVEYSKGKFLYIDENGLVLEVNTFYTEKLPIVVGLNINEFVVGQTLKVDNDVSFEVLVELNKLFNKYELQSEVIRINVGNQEDIYIYIDNVSVELGKMYDLDEKIATLKSIIENIPNRDMKWILDMKNTKRPAVLKLMT